ncbi:MAG: superoxide dismutase [Candidatus Woesearchaeota archaeon]
MADRYSLPELPYGYKDLEPHMSEEQIRIHHDKHHKAYVDGANAILDKLDNARKEGEELDMKAALKSLSWNVGGHVLHSLFWPNLSPNGGGEPEGKLKEAIDRDFGSFEQFRKEFSSAAKSVEGSGWTALTFCRTTGKLLIMQIEKHNTNIYPGFPVLLVLDMFEHAYYIDQKNEKGKYIDAFWNIVSWDEAGRRFSKAVGE